MNFNKKLWFIFMLSILSLSIFWPIGGALAQTGNYHDWHMGPGMMGHWGFGWYGGIFTMAFWVLILVGLIFLVKWLVQSSGRDNTTKGNTDRALEILKERYAMGEIEKEEFEIKKKDLSG